MEMRRTIDVDKTYHYKRDEERIYREAFLKTNNMRAKK